MELEEYMTLPSFSVDPLYRIYNTLTQFPILRTKIRSMMRKELYVNGILTHAELQEIEFPIVDIVCI